jgi:hypothetical protein
MGKTLMWRLQGIRTGVSKAEVLNCFLTSEQKRITVKTLYPTVHDPHHCLTAMIEYEHEEDNLEHVPCLRDLDLDIDCDFEGFTPLSSPAAGMHDAEYVVMKLEPRFNMAFE